MKLNKGQLVVVKAMVFTSTSIGRSSTMSEAWKNGANRDKWNPQVGRNGSRQLVYIHRPIEGERKRCLWHYEYSTPWRGIVVGYSFRQTGESVPSGYTGDNLSHDYEYQEGHLASIKRHAVVMVQPLSTERWLRPVACLEEDLRGIDLILRLEDGHVCLEESFGYPEGLIEHLANGDDFFILAEELCTEALEKSKFENYKDPERDAPIYLAYFEGEVITEPVYDILGKYQEVSMGGELLLLEEAR